MKACGAELNELPLGGTKDTATTRIGVRFRCLLDKGHDGSHRWWASDADLYIGWFKGRKASFSQPDKEAK